MFAVLMPCSFIIRRLIFDFYKLYRANVKTCHSTISSSATINIAIASGEFAPIFTDDSYPFFHMLSCYSIAASLPGHLCY